MTIASRFRFAALGAGLMWLFDPQKGEQRRAVVRKRVAGARSLADRVHVPHQVADHLPGPLRSFARRDAHDGPVRSTSEFSDLPAGVSGDAVTINELMDVARAYGVTGSFEVEGTGLRCTSCGATSAPEDVERIWLHRFEGASDPDELLTISAIRCPRCATLGSLITPYGPMADADESAIVLRLPVPTAPDSAPFTAPFSPAS